MNSTSEQLRVLKVWERYHREGLTLGVFLRTAWLPWLMLAGLAAVIWLLFSERYPQFATLACGVLGGAMLRDVNYFRSSARRWPVIDLVVDWEKVRGLIASSGE